MRLNFSINYPKRLLQEALVYAYSDNASGEKHSLKQHLEEVTRVRKNL